MRVALRLCKRLLPDSYDEYFEDVKTPQIIRKRPVVWEDELILSVIADETKPLEDRMFVAFLFVTQCRPSEMFALTWSDIDMRNGSVCFHKVVRKERGGFFVREGTKTGERGARTIPLGEVLCDMLRTVQKARMTSNEASEYVFLYDGYRLDKNRCRYHFRNVKQSLGLPGGPTLYSLKKSGNSFKARMGIDAETRAKLMGHTSVRMAQDVYRVVDNAEIVRAVNIVPPKALNA